MELPCLSLLLRLTQVAFAQVYEDYSHIRLAAVQNRISLSFSLLQLAHCAVTGSIIKARQHTLPVQVSLAPVHVQAASPPVLQSVQQPILQSTEAVKASEEVK